MYRCAFDGSVYVWDASSGSCLQAIRDHTRVAYTLTFRPDGKYMATGSGDGWLYVYNVAVRQSSSEKSIS